MNNLSIEECFFEGDPDFLREHFSEVEKLILENPFSERILFLLKNQGLAKKPVADINGEMGKPDCKGTAFWVAGVSRLDHPYAAYDSELNEHMIDEDDKRDELIKLMHSNPENKIPGAFCFSYCVESDGWHAGIYLGEIESDSWPRDILFAQHGTGGNFGIETSRCYSRPKYYIPKTLKK